MESANASDRTKSHEPLRYSDAIRKFTTKHPEIFQSGSRFTVAKSSHRVKLPTNLNRELCWLVGLIQGDGNISKTRILVSDSTEEFHRTISKCFQKQFGVNLNLFHDKNRNTFYSHTKSAVIAYFLAEVFDMTIGKKENVLVPKLIASASLANRTAYLKGLFDAEGSVSQRQAAMYISTTSNEIAEFSFQTLAEIGVKSSVRSRQRPGRRPEYDVEVYGLNDVMKFLHNVGSDHITKANKLLAFAIH